MSMRQRCVEQNKIRITKEKMNQGKSQNYFTQIYHIIEK